MARGWESKAVESQMEAAEARHLHSKGHELSAEELKIVRERESLELSRTRVLQDIASSENPRYKELMARSLQYLDEKLAELAARASRPDPRE